MRLFSLLAALLVGVGVAAAPLPAPVKCLEHAALHPKNHDEFPPPPQDDRGYDVLRYDLEFTLDPSRRTIDGQVSIDFRALAEGLHRVRLDLVDELVCRSVLGPDGALEFVHQGDSLVVDLGSAIPRDGQHRITVSWEGAPPRHGPFSTGLMFRNNDAGTPADATDDIPVVANMSQPWSSHSWWPCKDTPGDKAMVSMSVTVPADMHAVSNGTLIDSFITPAGATYRWREAYPIAPYLVSVAATEYSSWYESCPTHTGSDVPLEFHVFPHHREPAEFDLARTCEMMQFMTERAGPYPFIGEKYAQAELVWFGSMEHQTASSISQVIFTGDRRFEGIILHELAHQWFGDSLTPQTWADIWLNEGFARYWEALWIEHTEGVEAYQVFMRQIGPERHPQLFVGDGTLADPHPILPNALIYDKGGWVLHMLRMLIGDAAFFDFLRDYAGDPALQYGSVTLADMIAHAERAAGEDLTSFFDPWLRTSTVPVIATDLALDPAADPGHVEITFRQIQSPAFDLAVPVRFFTDCGRTDIVMRLRDRRQVGSWDLDCAVDSVAVDPDRMVLMRRYDDPPASVVVRGPVPNPVTHHADFELFLISDTQVVVKIYDARGRLLADYDLGHLAATGPPETESPRSHTWRWTPADGRRSPPSGIYWLEFSAADGGRQVHKVTLLN